MLFSTWKDSCHKRMAPLGSCGDVLSASCLDTAQGPSSRAFHHASVFVDETTGYLWLT